MPVSSRESAFTWAVVPVLNPHDYMTCGFRACDAKKDVHDATGLKQSSRCPKNDKLPCREDLRHANNMRVPHPRTLDKWRSFGTKHIISAWVESSPKHMQQTLHLLSGSSCRTVSSLTASLTAQLDFSAHLTLAFWRSTRSRASQSEPERANDLRRNTAQPFLAKTKQKPEGQRQRPWPHI